MNLNKIKLGVSKVAGRNGLILKKHSPELLVGVGVISVVAGTVLACRATLKAVEVVSELNAMKEIIHEASEQTEVEYSDADKQRELAIVYVQASVKLGKLYLPAVLLGMGGITAILGAHNIMHKRNAALMAAYSGLDKAFKEYQKRVANKWGEEEEFLIRHDLKKSKKSVDVIDAETGKVTKKKEEVLVKDNLGHSLYARFFDEYCSGWSPRADYNLIFLKQQQQYANDMLHARGHVMLNDVYDMLGLERSQAGAVVGWAVDAGGDNFIDFGIYDNVRFVNGDEASVLLDFNVNGVVYDYLV